MSHHVLFAFKVFMAIFVSIALILAFFYVGFMVGYSSGLGNGWLAAKNTLDASGLVPSIGLENLSVLSLEGTIENISGNQISIKAKNLNPNPLDSSTPLDRIVNISADTKFFKRTNKPSELFIAELNAFSKAVEAGNNVENLTPPLPYTEEEIGASLLKIDDTVIVEAADNIAFATEITAIKISIKEEVNL